MTVGAGVGSGMGAGAEMKELSAAELVFFLENKDAGKEFLANYNNILAGMRAERGAINTLAEIDTLAEAARADRQLAADTLEAAEKSIREMNEAAQVSFDAQKDDIQGDRNDIIRDTNLVKQAKAAVKIRETKVGLREEAVQEQEQTLSDLVEQNRALNEELTARKARIDAAFKG